MGETCRPRFSSGVKLPAQPGAFPPGRRALGERLVRVWIAVDPEESAVEPEAVDRHAAVAKLVQKVGHILRILRCQADNVSLNPFG